MSAPPTHRCGTQPATYDARERRPNHQHRIDGNSIAATTRFAYQRTTPAPEAIETTFANYFERWGLFLPDAAVATRSAGNLVGCCWMVRWRWHEDGSLEFRACHRITNERWHLISPTGETTWIDFPSEIMITQPGEDESRVRAEYQVGRHVHAEIVARRGMEFRSPDYGDHERLPVMAWKLDGGPWTASALPARHDETDNETDVSRAKRRLLALVNPRTPEGTLKDPEQIYRELKAQMDAKRDPTHIAKESQAQEDATRDSST